MLWHLDRYEEAIERGWEARKLYTHPQPQAEAVRVPDGYALVPVEPTLEMVEAGKDAKRRRLLASVKAIQNGEDPDELMGKSAGAEYRAMIAAAPKP